MVDESVTGNGSGKPAKAFCDAKLWWQAQRPQAQGQGEALDTLFQRSYQQVIVSWSNIWYREQTILKSQQSEQQSICLLKSGYVLIIVCVCVCVCAAESQFAHEPVCVWGCVCMCVC